MAHEGPEAIVTKEFRPTPVPRPQAPGNERSEDRSGDTVRLSGVKVPDLTIDDRAEKLGEGYNPYDTYPNARHADSTRKNSDLRKLSEWIRQKRLAEKNAPPASPASLEETMPGNKPFWPERR